ncbi:hypothetical protein CPT_Menos_052 [Burkholderia phage Menos]|uniref:Uncharacterized protein n=1 Tax=Burkholderia phage Menos TaxID=2924900 RepID=A0AAE9G8P3_9CAUD|nr:hypothetical protein CPT_Menos_052 [Burkholderia phage Menos]
MHKKRSFLRAGGAGSQLRAPGLSRPNQDRPTCWAVPGTRQHVRQGPSRPEPPY